MTQAGPDLAALDALAAQLDHLDRDGALALVTQMKAKGASVTELIADVLAPALTDVGRRWEGGVIGAGEALAEAGIIRAALPRSTAPTSSDRRMVAVCCPQGEGHEIAAEMLTEVLRASGWPAIHIGAGITAKQLPGFLGKQSPAALVVSCTTSVGLPGAARIIEAAHSFGVPVLVGGAGFGQDGLIALRLGAGAWAANAADAVAVLDGWAAQPPALAPGRPLSEEYSIFEAALSDIRANAVEYIFRDDPSGRDDPAGLTAAQDRLELLLRFLGAALLVDDGRLFYEFLSWRASYYRARHIGSDRLTDGLAAVAAALPSDATRARGFVRDGLQHLEWTVRSIRTSVPRRIVSATSNNEPAPSETRPMARPDEAGRVFADLLYVAAMTCHTPLALISAAHPDGRWSTLGHGAERRDLLVDTQLFATIAEGTEALEIPDLTLHPKLGRSHLATGPLGIRHVYGVPLRNRQSTLLGVLCVFDRRPRELSRRERQAMGAIGRQVSGQLALWRRNGGPQKSVFPDREGARSEPVLHRDGTEPDLLRSHEVAVLFDVTERTVINWAAAKKLPSIRTAGGHLRFRGEDVLALLAGRPPAGAHQIGHVGA